MGSSGLGLQLCAFKMKREADKVVTEGGDGVDDASDVSSDENTSLTDSELGEGVKEKSPAVADEMPKSAAKPTPLDLTMTAKEMREMILSKKKKDPRKEKRKDMRKRVEMVEAM